MARGGKRPGAGRKPGTGTAKPAMGKVERRIAEKKVPDRGPLVPAEARADFPAIDPRALQEMLPQIEEISKRYAIKGARRTRETSPFQFPKFPEGVEPKTGTMAMDGALQSAMSFGSQNWLAGETIAGLSGEGLLFLGYTYLSELAQRPEFRVISETIADDATRKWIDFDVTGDQLENQKRAEKDPKGEAERMADPDQKTKRLRAAGKLEKVKVIQDDQLRLGVKDRFYEQARNDGFFGRSHLYCDIWTNNTEPTDEELKQSIGNGRDELSKTKIPRGSFKALRTIEPVWTYPLAYNAINPLREDWYNPQTWFVMGKEIQGSRIPTFIGHPVPDMLKPAYAFGGLSLSQMAKPYVDIWLTTRESVGTLIHSFSVMVLMTDLSTLMQPGNVNALLARVAMFNMLRDNQGTFVVNKSTEDFKNVSASLSGLHELQAQSQEHMASVSRIPLVKLTGISPSGLNASSEGEILVYDDTIMAYQSRFFAPNLTRVINYQQLSCFGEIDPEITWHFNTLRQPTEAEKGDLQKKQAERDQLYVDMGAISPGEVRKTIIDNRDLPFADLDPDDVPEPPDPMGMGGEEGGDDETGGAEPAPKPQDREGASDADVAHFFATDAAWNEADHDRAPDGKFGSGGGSSKPAISPKGLKKTGSQMGSNEGGVFETPEGEKLYIKRPPSKAHVENERAAARLYQLAGVNTLNYRDVEGGNHVATELVKLDKNNISKMTPAERKEAAKDFVVHAWLSNWDAAGTGGDNQGVVDGKVTTLDVGGSLRYRAQGGPKGKAFGPKVTELETMRNPSMSPDAARLYGKMTDAELADAAAKVTSIKNDDIRKAVGDDQELADTLIARKKDIAAQFKLATDDAPWDESKHPRSPDGKFGSGGGGSASEEGGKIDIATLLSKPPIAGANYRRQLVKAIKTAQGSQKQKLTENLIASWVKTGINAAKKGDIQAAGKIVDKVTALGGDPTEIKSAWSAAKPAEPAPKPAEAAKKVEKIIEQKPPEPLPAPTEAELQKAKKATPTNVSLLGGPTNGPFAKTAQEIVDKFNEKYAKKEIADKPGLIQKVHDFKALKSGMLELDAANHKHLTEVAAVAKAEAAKTAKAAAEKAAEDAKRAAEKNAKIMADLGISAQQAEGMTALAQMLGSKTGDVVEKFKAFAKQAQGYGYPITGFQCALIKNYSNGGYSAVNSALRSGAWTPAQHVYVAMVNKALLAMPTYTGTVKRGTELPASELAKYQEGKIIQDQGFMSTASSGSGFGGPVRFTIKAIGKRGASIEKLSNHPHESEVLFAARTFFKVNKVTKDSSGVTHIDMEEWEEH